MKHYYETEAGKLFCCDNVIYLNTVNDNTFDLTVTSPPYDNLRDYKGYSWNFEELAKELYRTTKQGGVVVWVVGDATINGSETGSSFRQALYFMECGFNLHDTMIYQKQWLHQNCKRYQQEFEYMFVFTKSTINTFNCLKEKKLYMDKRKPKQRKDSGKKKYQEKVSTLKSRGNVWKYDVGGRHVTKDKIAYEHPAIFPEKLAYDHIVSWSNEGDIVFDPFMGSGTTAKMAERSNRRWIGCEISKEYCEIAKERIDNEREQLRLEFE